MRNVDLVLPECFSASLVSRILFTSVEPQSGQDNEDASHVAITLNTIRRCYTDVDRHAFWAAGVRAGLFDINRM